MIVVKPFSIVVVLRRAVLDRAMESYPEPHFDLPILQGEITLTAYSATIFTRP